MDNSCYFTCSLLLNRNKIAILANPMATNKGFFKGMSPTTIITYLSFIAEVKDIFK